jgi:hypothetical protein
MYLPLILLMRVSPYVSCFLLVFFLGGGGSYYCKRVGFGLSTAFARMTINFVHSRCLLNSMSC